ncbi:MAG: hypothetical protein ACO34E_04645 [Limisphaerales bacterium]
MLSLRPIVRCLLAVMVLLLVSGCGGVSGSHSVSPSTFLLPGFGQAEPESVPDVGPMEGSGVLVAQSR